MVIKLSMEQVGYLTGMLDRIEKAMLDEVCSRYSAEYDEAGYFMKISVEVDTASEDSSICTLEIKPLEEK